MDSPLSSSFLFLSLFVLVFMQQLSMLRGWNVSDPYLAQIADDLYHSSDDLLKEIRDLVSRHPEKLQMEVMQAGNRGYFAEIMVATYTHASREIANNTEFRALLSFGQHGREIITSEVALRLLSILSGEHHLLGWDSVSSNNALGKLIVKIVPMENLNGRKLVEEGDACERRNGRGVDLNRNWSVDWGKKEKDFDPYEEFPGTSPFSEPEVQIMRKLSNSFKPHLWVNIHSGMEGLFMPYDHKNTTADGPTSQMMRSVLENLNHYYCQDRCIVGSGGGSVGYLAHGTATDYMYIVGKVPLAFTFEIYGDPKASRTECLKMFNPIDIISFNRVLDNWCLAFLKIFQTAPQQLEMMLLKMSSNFLDSNTEDGRLKGILDNSIEVIDFGMQELRTYFRLFMLSSVLLMFMFCSRISKSRFIPTKPNISI